MNLLIGILSAEYDRFEAMSGELFMLHRTQFVCMYRQRARLYMCRKRKPDGEITGKRPQCLTIFYRADANEDEEKSIRKAIRNDTAQTVKAVEAKIEAVETKLQALETKIEAVLTILEDKHA